MAMICVEFVIDMRHCKFAHPTYEQEPSAASSYKILRENVPSHLQKKFFIPILSPKQL